MEVKECENIEIVLPININILINEIIVAKNDALDFVLSKYNIDFGWTDFKTNSSGQSDSWVSCYIFWKLHNILPVKFLDNYKNNLVGYIHSDKGIGYSKLTSSDTDSTIHFINAWLTLGLPINDITEQINYVLNHKNSDGGFNTYSNQDISLLIKKYENLDGWLHSHTCVSVFALLTLDKYKLISKKDKEHSLKYLISNQKKEGFWESYWWHSNFFATSYFLKYLITEKKNDEDLEFSFHKGLEYLKVNYNQNGFWTNGINTAKPCLISTVLNCEFLLFYDPAFFVENYSEALYWILKSKFENGYWISEPILQIPAPNVISLENYIWDFNKFGVGSVTKDQSNLYTTATVISFLNHLIKYLKNGKL